MSLRVSEVQSHRAGEFWLRGALSECHGSVRFRVFDYPVPSVNEEANLFPRGLQPPEIDRFALDPEDSYCARAAFPLDSPVRAMKNYVEVSSVHLIPWSIW